MYPFLEKALQCCSERIVIISALDVKVPLVVDQPHPSEMTGWKLQDSLPAADILNIRPYRRPATVEAAGGIITRPRNGVLHVLLIYRRGVWDLPKGKRDAGESLKACARREVCEELGIDNLDVLRPLGRTVHGYVERAHYAVKTTHWFHMSTPATFFTPQAEEGIEDVEWVPWETARERLGYEILRRHLRVVGDVVGA